MSIDLKKIALLCLLSVVSYLPCSAQDQNIDDTLRVTTEFTYRLGDGDTEKQSKALALFGAKFKAISLVARCLTHKNLLEHYEKKQNEIFCLATNEIDYKIVDEKSIKKNRSFYIRINAKVGSVDFIKAEIRNLENEKKEALFSYSDEMGQPVIQEINPGEELSRAYRYIRKKKWRISIIYLDHLEKKYPHWGEVFYAKAIAFYGLDDIEKMAGELKSACSLNNQRACEELASFSSNKW